MTFSKTLAMISLFMGLASMPVNSQAGSTKCMGKVLDYVLADFESKRSGEGLIVYDRRVFSIENVLLNLGQNVVEDSVEIQDINKDSYDVRIHLRYIDDIFTNSHIRTTIVVESYQTCEISKEYEIEYILFKSH